MAIILQIPSGVAAAIAAISSVLIAKRLNRIVFTGIAVTILSFLGCLLMIVVPGAGKLAGYYISWTMTGTGAILTTLTSNNVSGYTKKTFYNGAVVVAMTIGNFCGPLMMTGNQAPYYTGSMIGYVVANLVIVICFVLLYIIMLRENKRRLANPPETKSDPHLDLTDKEDRNILYIL
jgi:ACS family allantoate permease-like MFS transporter